MVRIPSLGARLEICLLLCGLDLLRARQIAILEQNHVRRYAPEHLKNDWQFTFTAVQRNGLATEHAAEWGLESRAMAVVGMF